MIAKKSKDRGPTRRVKSDVLAGGVEGGMPAGSAGGPAQKDVEGNRPPQRSSR